MVSAITCVENPVCFPKITCFWFPGQPAYIYIERDYGIHEFMNHGWRQWDVSLHGTGSAIIYGDCSPLESKHDAGVAWFLQDGAISDARMYTKHRRAAHSRNRTLVDKWFDITLSQMQIALLANIFFKMLFASGFLSSWRVQVLVFQKSWVILHVSTCSTAYHRSSFMTYDVYNARQCIHLHMLWVVPPPSNSHHQDHYIFSRGSL